MVRRRRRAAPVRIALALLPKPGRRTNIAKVAKVQPWTKDDTRLLKTLARGKVTTGEIARKLKRSIGATYQKAMRLGVPLSGGRKRKG